MFMFEPLYIDDGIQIDIRSPQCAPRIAVYAIQFQEK